jgi:NAD(P)-dependent dehydrogenase (short-subunit alcohol dehydrogenase family)
MSDANWTIENIPDQSGRVVVITGATSGIGKETARVLAAKNASVIIGARNLAKAERVVSALLDQHPDSAITIHKLDLSDLASVETFADHILRDHDRLDVLINNAGVMACPYAKTADGFELQMGTNHLGHFALSLRLLPLLQATPESRLVVLSSVAHRWGKIDFTDLNWEGRRYRPNQAYGDSKIANLLFVHELARRLQDSPQGPLVTAAHPGWTETELQRHTPMIAFTNRFFAQGTDQGVLPTLRAAIDPTAQPGDYYGPARWFEMRGAPVKVHANARSQDPHLARQLWEQSLELTGTHFPTTPNS